MRIILNLIALLIGGLLLSGSCASPPTPASVQIKIEIVDAAEEWRPSTVTIAAGGVVTWLNTSSIFPHAIISGEGLFNENLSPGQSFNYTFTRSGTFTYHDDPYTSVGKVYVK